MQPERVNMKCPKCGGRTITEDVHTYLGQQLERKCISCGKRFVEGIASNSSVPLEVEATPEPPRQSKSIGTCSVCNRPNQYLTRGMCCRDYQRWRKATLAGSAETPVESQPQSQSPWRSQLYNRNELAKHEAKQPAAIPFEFESEEEKAYQTGAPMPSAPSAEPIVIGIDLSSGPDSSSVQVRSGQVRSGQVRSGQVRSGQVRSGARPSTRSQSKFSR